MSNFDTRVCMQMSTEIQLRIEPEVMLTMSVHRELIEVCIPKICQEVGFHGIERQRSKMLIRE